MRLPRALDGLTFRIGLLLTIALFPIGLIAISLTRQIAQQESQRAETSLLALTAEAAASEESFMRAGATVAGALAASVPVVRDILAECDGIFTAFIQAHSQYTFAGYINRDGIAVCASEKRGADLSNTSIFQKMKASPVPRIDVTPKGAISGLSVIVLSQPLFDKNGGFDGYVAVSLPNQRIFRNLEILSVERPLELVTFNDQGAILSAESGLQDVGNRLPRDRTLSSFVGRPRVAFTGETVGGEERVFAVVPIISDKVYALGSWPVTRIHSGFNSMFLSPLLFPSLMWLVSLGVAYMAVHRLAIRNITDLRVRMSQFINGRRFQRSRPGLRMPLEFREIDQTWEELADTVIREEAELENTIHGRTVLLKEVHHRVKNNLQLIASIVSMKIRKSTSPEARTVLKEVQMRVMSIATVHQALYTTSTVGRVQADELLENIVAKTIEVGLQPTGAIRIETSYEPMSLYPDQAVPLSLLASEAVTNALKYVGRPADGVPWISVRLMHPTHQEAALEIENSCGDPMIPAEQARGTGLGASLIKAFTQQMRGAVTITNDPGHYLVRVTFPIVEFDDQPVETSITESEDEHAVAQAQPADGDAGRA